MRRFLRSWVLGARRHRRSSPSPRAEVTRRDLGILFAALAGWALLTWGAVEALAAPWLWKVSGGSALLLGAGIAFVAALADEREKIRRTTP